MASKKPSTGGKSGMNVDTALVRELAELLNETGLTEIEVEDDDRKIRVARGGASIVAAPAMAAPAAAPAPAAAVPAPAEPPKKKRTAPSERAPYVPPGARARQK